MFSEIPAKAHMSDKSIIHEYVSPDISAIGPWAYSGCSNMTDIRLPAGCDVANTAFKGCDELAYIYLYRKDDPDYVNHINISPYLLALMIKAWPKETSGLIRIASETQTFLREFDDRMTHYMLEPDETGFVPFLAGGEEDYDDNDEALRRFAGSVLRRKILMIYERLFISRSDSEATSVPDDIYSEYLGFLRSNNPVPAFSVLTESKVRRSEFAGLYFDLELNKEVSNEELLKLASSDTSLRARILVNTSGPGHDLNSYDL